MNNQTLLCRYTYDPLDRLAASAQSGQPISQCFYQAGQLQGEVQGATRRMLMRYGTQLLAQRDELDGLSDQQLLASDRQHSVLHAIGRQSQQTIAYTPYGHRPPDSGLTVLSGFAGERLDPLTGHYLLGNGYRSFNPVLMRFNSPDSLSPFGDGGFNAYAYCLGDPVNYLDPDGHIPWWIGLVAGVAATVLTVGIAAPVTAALGVSAATAGAVAAVATKVSIAATVISVGSGFGSAMTKGGLSEGLGWLSLGSGIVAGVAGGVAIGAKVGARVAAASSARSSQSGSARTLATQGDPKPSYLSVGKDLDPDAFGELRRYMHGRLMERPHTGGRFGFQGGPAGEDTLTRSMRIALEDAHASKLHYRTPMDQQLRAMGRNTQKVTKIEELPIDAIRRGSSSV